MAWASARLIIPCGSASGFGFGLCRKYFYCHNTYSSHDVEARTIASTLLLIVSGTLLAAVGKATTIAELQ